jgi:hypothetical protein
VGAAEPLGLSPGSALPGECSCQVRPSLTRCMVGLNGTLGMLGAPKYRRAGAAQSTDAILRNVCIPEDMLCVVYHSSWQVAG